MPSNGSRTITKDKYTLNALLCMKYTNSNIPPEINEKIMKKALAYEVGGMCFCRCEQLKYQCSVCKYACCDDCIGIMCMCLQATQCHKHGFRCNGSHD
jgi:hypothetical protein